jgi:hypothetical protein
MANRLCSVKLGAFGYQQFVSNAWLALLFLMPSTSAVAQKFHFGVKGGVPLTEYFESGPGPRTGRFTEFSSATRRYTVGPSFELRLNDLVGFEVDALYKRLGYSGRSFCGLRCQPQLPCQTCLPIVGISTFEDVKGNSWDFPMMAKFRFGQRLHPYLAGGFVLRRLGSLNVRGVNTSQELQSGRIINTPFTSVRSGDTFVGLSVGAGIEFGLGRLRLLPELRYTGWTQNGDPRFEPNQAEVLLGISF